MGIGLDNTKNLITGHEENNFGVGLEAEIGFNFDTFRRLRGR
jgi:hypothetical protein